MPLHWMKPLGVTDPFDPMEDDWTRGADLANYVFTTGPKQRSNPPPVGEGSLVVFHAVHHGHIFAIARVTGAYGWRQGPLDPPEDRWPWEYPCVVEAWVPLIKSGPKSADVAPQKAIGRIRAGGAFAKLSTEEYTRIRDALLACPTSRTRSA